MYYRVKLFKINRLSDIEADIRNGGYKPEFVDYVLVRKNLRENKAKELMTNLQIDILPEQNYLFKGIGDFEGIVDFRYVARRKLARYGFQFFTLDSDYIEWNEITEGILDDYIEHFTESMFEFYYYVMKVTDEEKRNVLNYIKSKIKIIKEIYRDYYISNLELDNMIISYASRMKDYDCNSIVNYKVKMIRGMYE